MRLSPSYYGDVRVELHFHLLPGVDDGPTDEGASIDLAWMAVADGTRRVVATPHAHAVALGEVPARVAALTAALAAHGVPLTVSPGAELLPGDVLGADDGELDAIAQGPRGRRWVLLEAPPDDRGGEDVAGALARLAELGLGALIAHPERSPYWWETPGSLEHALAIGARLQVNASSLTGAHGATASRRAVDLVRAGRVAALASDAHGAARPPSLTAALDVLADHGAGGATLAGPAPRALLEHGLPPLMPATRAREPDRPSGDVLESGTGHTARSFGSASAGP